MSLQGPGDEAITQKHRISRSGSTSVGTTCPISVSVDDEIRRRGTMKKQIVVEAALEIAKDALHNREMGSRE
jgi:hypothetical protein